MSLFVIKHFTYLCSTSTDWVFGDVTAVCCGRGWLVRGGREGPVRRGRADI